MKVRIVSDSSCDLPAPLVEELGIEIVPLSISIGHESYLDGVELSRDQFYANLPNYASHPTTSVPSPGSFIHTYERLAAAGATDIVSIHISSTLSGVTNSANLAAREISGAEVTVFDSRQLSLGTGFMVEAAARAAMAGRPLTEIMSLLESMARRARVFAVLDSVEYLRRSGRISGFASGVATLFHIKPLLKMQDGVATSEKVRTMRHGLNRLVELLGEVGSLEKFALVHADAEDRAVALLEKARSVADLPERPMIVSITPVFGAHLGPGAVGFALVAAE